jgi:hypothetical protein
MDGYMIDRIEKAESWLIGGGVGGVPATRSIDPSCSNTRIADYSSFDDACTKPAPAAGATAFP